MRKLGNGLIIGSLIGYIVSLIVLAVTNLTWFTAMPFLLIPATSFAGGYILTKSLGK